MYFEEQSILNRSIWITTLVMGIVLAISAIHHGIFEVMQNGKIIDTFIIQSIGPKQQRWLNGQEVFSILSNYYITGISTILISVAIIIWSFFALNRYYGPAILFLLFILVTFVGGGIIFILFYFPVCLFAFRIRNQLSWQGKGHSDRFIGIISRIWPYSLLLTCLLFLASLEISLFGIEGRSNSEISIFMYTSLIFAAVFMMITYFSAVIRDIYAERTKLTGSN
ncbi:hypothetical protein ACFLT1_00450 [Bacteroidota bacterium]